MSFLPTEEGFQEVWDSMQKPSIEQLMAGIQCKIITREKLLEMIQYFRKSRTKLEQEIDRLETFKASYNFLWATSKIYSFGLTEALQNRIQSTCKRWVEMLKLTSPRFKASAVPPGQEQTVYRASYLTKKTYQLDVYGPDSYGHLLTDLYDELQFIEQLMERGKQICQEAIEQEKATEASPTARQHLYDMQYRQVQEDCHTTIESHYQVGYVNYSNPLYKVSMTYDDREQFKMDYFHKSLKPDYVDFVITLTTLELLGKNVTPLESRLLGDKFSKVSRVRLAMKHLDQLLDVKPGGKFHCVSIVQAIRWCGIQPSIKRHKDTEREFYEKYMKANYKGTHSWPAWNTVFMCRQGMGDSETQVRLDAKSFETRFSEVCKTELSQLDQQDN